MKKTEALRLFRERFPDLVSIEAVEKDQTLIITARKPEVERFITHLLETMAKDALGEVGKGVIKKHTCRSKRDQDGTCWTCNFNDGVESAHDTLKAHFISEGWVDEQK